MRSFVAKPTHDERTKTSPPSVVAKVCTHAYAVSCPMSALNQLVTEPHAWVGRRSRFTPCSTPRHAYATEMHAVCPSFLSISLHSTGTGMLQVPACKGTYCKERPQQEEAGHVSTRTHVSTEEEGFRGNGDRWGATKCLGTP